MDNKIVNGDLVEEGRYPYMAALFEENNHFCGGTLITPNLILTTAHCLEDFPLVKDLQVALNCVNITSLTNCNVFTVSNYTLHPDFDLELSSQGGNDVALVVLNESSTIQPIQVAAPGLVFTDENIFTVGWGNEEPVTEVFNGSTFLREAEGNLLSNDDCFEKLDDILDISPGVQQNDLSNIETMMCSIGNSEASCRKDNGGPLLLQCNGGEQDLQLGMISIPGCGFEGFPDIVSRTFTQSSFEYISSAAEELGQLLNLSLRSNLVDFCLDGQIDVPRNPTPFPTFPNNVWTCDPNFFAAQDGCDCECGFPDPDCDFDDEVDNIFGCDNRKPFCVDGFCSEDGNTNSPTILELKEDVEGVETLLVVLFVLLCLCCWLVPCCIIYYCCCYKKSTGSELQSIEPKATEEELKSPTSSI